MAKKNEIRPGWQSSEFILSTLAVVAGAIASSGLLAPASPVVVIAGLIATVLAALGYTASRTRVKTSENNNPTQSNNV